MNNSLKFLALLLAAGSLAAWQVPAASTNATAPAKPAPRLDDLFAGQLVAKGKNLEIKRSQLDEAMVNIKAGAVAQGRTIPPEHLSMLEQQVLQRLIQIQLLLSQATDADKGAGKTSTAQRIDAIKTRAGSDENLNRQLKAAGTTLDELKIKMAEEATAEYVLERALKIEVTPEQVKKFYDDNPSKFEKPERVRVSHILITTKDPKDTTGNPAQQKDLPDDQKKAKRKQIDDLLKRARAGEDFTKLAKEFSEDPAVKQNDGEYTFSREDPFVAEFKAAAFALAKPNDISDVVTTMFGYHILKLNEKIPAKKIELAEVSNDIHDYLVQQAMQEKRSEMKDYTDKLSKDAGVEILDEQLKPKDMPALPAGHPPIPPAPKAEVKPAAK
jgi:peptidyl-prolyl cis-trans isomerase C